ncbi:MAG: LolA-like protein [Planctomycetota bacterium]|jgi:hypothetical protein
MLPHSPCHSIFTYRPASASSLVCTSALVALCALGTTASPAFAAPPVRADKILDRFIEVTGGKDAYASLENRVTKMTIEPVGTGLKMNVTNYAARPDKTFSVIEAEAMGQILKGTNGDLVWESSLMSGPVLKTGTERELVLRGSVFDKHVRWRKIYRHAEFLGLVDVEGKPAYKIELTPHQGSADIAYFDKKSGLQVKVDITLVLPMGTIPIEIFLSDYKEVDGVLYPHKARRFAAGQEMLIVTESVKHNVDLPADQFKLPDDVQALADKQAASVPRP